MKRVIALAILFIALFGMPVAHAVTFRIDFSGTLASDWGSLLAGSAISGSMRGDSENFMNKPRHLTVSIGNDAIALTISSPETGGRALLVGVHNDTDMFVTEPDVVGDVFEIYAFLSGHQESTQAIDDDLISGFVLFLFDPDGLVFNDESLPFGTLDLNAFESRSMYFVSDTSGAHRATVASLEITAVPLLASLWLFGSAITGLGWIGGSRTGKTRYRNAGESTFPSPAPNAAVCT